MAMKPLKDKPTLFNDVTATRLVHSNEKKSSSSVGSKSRS